MVSFNDGMEMCCLCLPLLIMHIKLEKLFAPVADYLHVYLEFAHNFSCVLYEMTFLILSTIH